jgi:hypothetical protein
MIAPAAQRLTDDDVRALCRIAAQVRQHYRDLHGDPPTHTEPGIPQDACTRGEISVTLRNCMYGGTTRHDH